MSTALAIAGVTAVLRDLLNDGLVNHNVSGLLGSTVIVSVVPPDRVMPADGTEQSQLNLFLHQVAPNAGWRNDGFPAIDGAGRQRVGNPPLALNLHYLLSAYSGADLHAEILLGYAMQLLHEHPVLSRQALRTALSPSPDVGAALPPALRALADCGLADQVEQLRITPEYLNTEEMSKLWTATQSHFRPTAAYQVAVVLIESTQPARSPLPVLTRGHRIPGTNLERGVVVEPDLVPPVPMLDDVVLSGDQPAAYLGEPVELHGHHLAGTGREVVLSNARFAIEETLSLPDSDEPSRLQFVVPDADPEKYPVGVYDVSVRVVRPGEAHARETNRLAFLLAPRIAGVPFAVARDTDGSATFTLEFVPSLRAGQTVSLVLGAREVAPESHGAPTGSLHFVVTAAVPGSHLVRLRIDGIESRIIDRSKSPPEFFDHRITIT